MQGRVVEDCAVAGGLVSGCYCYCGYFCRGCCYCRWGGWWWLLLRPLVIIVVGGELVAEELVEDRVAAGGLVSGCCCYYSYFCRGCC